MAELTYKLEVFEGPLDLLLDLIEKHQLDIYDIKISLLTEQYMLYIEEAREQDWNLTADFIEMAARLLYIKSYSLLPVQEDEEEDPKADLEQLLRDYAMYKRISQDLKDEYIGAQIFFREVVPTGLPKPPANYNYAADRLELAYRRVVSSFAAKNITPKTFNRLIGTKIVSVNSRILYVLKKVRRQSRVRFEAFFDECQSRSEIIATFLAILELLRAGRLDTDENGDDIIMILNTEVVR
ncbi:MAG: hypothetical protein DBX47_07315 [Clostridiales bacterium]|nr:MAG: hypothetical protein DBX47_07315 [Clostridiales bacterium]